MLTESTPMVTTENGKSLPPSRVRDAKQGHSIFSQLVRDDEMAAWKRSNLDYMIDGGKPYSEAVMRDAGRGDDANLNFMEGKAEEDSASTPYVEMTTQTDVFWRVKVDYGNTTERNHYSKVLSEELTKVHKGLGADFHFERLGLVQQFTRHGLGFVYWQDEFDWRWHSEGLDAFKLSRKTPSRPSAIGYIVCQKTMGVNELHEFIKNEQAAIAGGKWNVKAVKQAICQVRDGSNRGAYSETSWNTFVQDARENDMAIGATTQDIPIYHLWVKEFNDEWSHYIGHQGGAIEDEGEIIGNGWLYVHRFRFKNITQCIIPFPYGVGTHRTYHTIRGQGEMSFDSIQVGNRAWCKMIDCAGAATSIIMQADTPADMENAAYVQRGPFLIVSGQNKITPTAMPDVGDRLMPLLKGMQTLRRNNTSQFVPVEITDNTRDYRTKYGTQAEQISKSQLSSAAMTLFLEPWGQVGHEAYRRLINPKLREDDPGGKEAFEFRIACMKKGVPPEAFKAKFQVEAVRAIGNGSPNAAQYAAEKVWELAGSFDEPGRDAAKRDVLASIPGVGYENVERYVGPDGVRPTVDDEFAELENNDFRVGQAAVLTSTQNHYVHSQHHGSLITQMIEAFEDQQIPPEELVTVLAPALQNMLEHSAELDKDDTRVREAATVRKFIQNANGTLQQQEQSLIAKQRAEYEATEQAQTQGGNGSEPPDVETLRKLEHLRIDNQRAEAEFRNRQREFEQKLAQQAQEAAQRRQLKDLEKAQELAAKNARMAAEASV